MNRTPHGSPTARRIISIPQWANRVGLAADGKSIAAARGLIAQGDGPVVTQIGRREGVRLKEHEAWTQATPWAKYIGDLTAAERDRIVNFVGDAAYAVKLYDRYCASRWPHQMSFEKWLKRRQRLKDKHTSRPRNNKGGGSR